MEQTELEIGFDCKLVKTDYGNLAGADVSLDYIEHSQDHYHSDNESSIDLDRDKAVEIVEFLREAFDL